MGGDLEEAPATRAAGAGDEKKADDEADDEEDEERGGAGFPGVNTPQAARSIT